jgi:hypothetical protein
MEVQEVIMVGYAQKSGCGAQSVLMGIRHCMDGNKGPVCKCVP